jgi:aldehyde dehydrogenase (NAD+)
LSTSNAPCRAAIERLCEELRAKFADLGDELDSLNADITNDTAETIEHDRTVVLEHLASFDRDFYAEELRCKPKGSVLILSSYNEPYLMNVLPVLNALAAGNAVYFRPSNRALVFARRIWQSALRGCPEFAERLCILDDSYEDIYGRIPRMDAVYFFGGQHNAKKVAKLCAAHLVEFWPETEGADHAVYFSGGVSREALAGFADYCLHAAYTHGGQMCQRLQGIFVQADSTGELVCELQDAYGRLKARSFSTLLRRSPSELQLELHETFLADARTSQAVNAQALSGRFTPSLLIEPHHASKLCRTAYFLPTFWVISFASDAELQTMLCSRPLHFGINIWCPDQSRAQELISRTSYTRYTLNADHTRLRPGEGWGGSAPTSYGGYTSWRAKFSKCFTVLTDATTPAEQSVGDSGEVPYEHIPVAGD